MRALAANTLLILIVLGVVFLTGLGIAKKDFAAPGPSTDDVIVSIPRGTGPHKISVILTEAGVLREKAVMGFLAGDTLFRMGARYQGLDRKMRFGEYRFPAGASMEQVLAQLVKGGNVRYNVTVAEGLTSWQVVQRLNENALLTGEITEIPPEGSLMPDTYSVNRDEPRPLVIQRMQAAMTSALDEAWAARSPDNPLTSKREMLILASIVERETRPAEHAKVASVMYNRLNKGMRLEVDAAVRYGITLGKGPLRRGLRQSELDRATPYNLYLVDGLPPTPIANPGRESLMAVAQPADTPYFFFVADGTGGHAFAETLAEHNRNVAKWREIERQRNANQ